jgi:Cu/Ag efflux protein CusF
MRALIPTLLAAALWMATPLAMADPVHTRGELRATSQDQDGRQYAHIKLAPGQKIPFSTLTYRVLDPALLQGMKPGTAVEFLAQRRDGENVLTAIRPARTKP